ncbi:MAG: hypothetical protein IPG69_12225 [Flavobacteriales bacterium]|nr:hypothetical protein [Flavobacteriales bacterium]
MSELPGKHALVAVARLVQHCDITFKCAIIGTSTMVPPPIFVRRDGVGDPPMNTYGFAGLIPPPNEVIPSTITRFRHWIPVTCSGWT